MNPFLITNYKSPKYFCDRKTETADLLQNIKSKTDTAFFAQRRIGKTALIRHVFYLLKKESPVSIYLDIYATVDLGDFTNQLANAIYTAFPPKQSIGQRFLEAIKSLRPVITLDEITGTPQLSLDISKTAQFERTIPQLLKFLDSEKVEVIMAIDEFQQILQYPEKNVEALLRTVMQTLQNVHFIFCGSNQKMMHQIFNNAKRPFYASTKNINLQRIDRQEYSKFIKSHFQKNKIDIDANAIALILDLTDCHTYYTQRLSHEVFEVGVQKVLTDTVLQALNKILTDNENIYFQYRNLITTNQWKLLKALSIEEKTFQPYGKRFLKEHDLGSSAIVKRSLEALVEKELLYYHSGIEVPYYEVYDKFLMRWMQNKYST